MHWKELRYGWDGRLLGAGLLAAMLFVVPPGSAADADAKTLDGKVLFGYQGWFNCAGDGAPENNWRSWARGTPAPDTLTIDMYPDLREFSKDDLCAAPGFTIGGKQAYFYSAWNPKVVNAHFRWMKEYGLDGVLAQRFVTAIGRRRSSGDVLLKNIMAAARAHGRVFAIEYDVTGSPPDQFMKALQEDWKYLVEELKVTAHPMYLHHGGRPVVSVWGQGLEDARHPPREPEAAKQVVRWFQSEAPEKMRVTYMGGTPARWRTLSRDAQKDPGWAEAYARMDVIQPWTVGRYRDLASVDEWRKDVLEPDIARVAENGKMYMPVIFPGFSWANLKKGDPPNRIPRLGGQFLWRQAYNARVAGARMLKIAMFDEVNEGTAMYKLAAKRGDAPEQGYWLTLDADGMDLPGDWYLKLAREITRMFHGEIPPAEKMPR
ncbi:MAG: hypothetical protein JNK48_25770 [Bryobacterales bacterium]|nr:hypothetical protein [Bryobacterales bacterium]